MSTGTELSLISRFKSTQAGIERYPGSRRTLLALRLYARVAAVSEWTRRSPAGRLGAATPWCSTAAAGCALRVGWEERPTWRSVALLSRLGVAVSGRGLSVRTVRPSILRSEPGLRALNACGSRFELHWHRDLVRVGTAYRRCEGRTYSSS